MEGLSFPTETSTAQWELELMARDIYAKAARSDGRGDIREVSDDGDDDDDVDDDDDDDDDADGRGWERHVAVLRREEHVAYLRRSLGVLSAGHVVLDASRCWLCYWIVHSLALLGAPLSDDAAADVVEFLALCQHPSGGFGGGPGQMPHLAPTYAALCCLAEIATPAALAVVDRPSMRAFLLKCKDQASGGYRMHVGGETDTRGCYTALAVAHLLGLIDAELTAGVAEFVTQCQTHEGGIGGEPGAEAHGGYTFCGLAAAILCGRADALDLPELLHWLVHRQGQVEGGFNGRTNKLVDGCYSFWQGGAFPLMALSIGAVLRAMPTVDRPPAPAATPGAATVATESESMRGIPACTLFPTAAEHWDAGGTPFDPSMPPFSSRALQGWLLLCCQLPNGGLQDKPGKGRDHYHTCYCLSGLSTAQHWGRDGLVGPEENVLERTNPLVNVTEARYLTWMTMLAGTEAGAK